MGAILVTMGTRVGAAVAAGTLSFVVCTACGNGDSNGGAPPGTNGGASSGGAANSAGAANASGGNGQTGTGGGNAGGVTGTGGGTGGGAGGSSGTGGAANTGGSPSDGGAGTPGTCNAIPTFEDGRTPSRELHVATTGSDTAGDGSTGNPFASVDRAADA